MAHRDPNTLDLSQQTFCLASDLRFWPIHQRGELVYRIEIPKLHRFFRVGYQEYVFLSLLDGKTTIPQACGLAAAKLGNDAPTSSDAIKIVRWLISNDLAHLPDDPAPNRNGPQKTESGGNAAKFLAKLNPFWIKLPLAGSVRFIDAASRVLRPCFGTTATSIGLGSILVATCILFIRWAEFSASSSALFLPGNWFGILVAWVILKVVHELAHAVVCHRLGGQVREAGLVFVLFAPIAYVDVSSCWRMNSRWARIAVSAAGMYVELLIAAIAVFGWIGADSDALRFLCFQVIVTAGMSTLLFNANVLMRFDGYFILADLIDVPNLYAESSSAVKHSFQWLITGESANQSSLGTWRKYFAIGYGLAAMAWRFVVCGTLFIAASTMFSGAGILIAALGLCLWLSGPIRSMFDSMQRHAQQGWFAALRPASVCLTMTLSACWFLIWCPVPTSVTVPSIVQYLPETMVRSESSGFVTKIHVDDGDQVTAGDVLMELQNRDLSNRLALMDLTSQQNEIRLRQATESHDSSMQQVIRADQLSLQKQMEPLRRQVASLTVVAPRTGRVIARSLRHRLDEYVSEGEALMVVASQQDKMAVAVIDQSEIEESRRQVGRDVRLMTANRNSFGGVLQRIEPRVTDRLPSPALAVTEGGPLAVRASDEDQSRDEMRLLNPSFRGRVDLSADAAKSIPAGTRISTSLGYKSDSLAIRWRNAIRELWFQSKLKR